MENPIAAQEFLEEYLPTSFKERINLSTVKVEKESFQLIASLTYSIWSYRFYIDMFLYFCIFVIQALKLVCVLEYSMVLYL